MAMYFKCKICGEEHQAPITVSSYNSFKTRTDVAGMSFNCIARWKFASYEKDDLYWKDDVNPS